MKHNIPSDPLQAGMLMSRTATKHRETGNTEEGKNAVSWKKL